MGNPEALALIPKKRCRNEALRAALPAAPEEIGGDAAWALRDRRGPTKSCAAAFTSNGSRPNETTEANSTLEPNETVPFRKKLYAGWMTIVARFGHSQTLVMMAAFYFFLIGPVSIVSRLFGSDMLGKRGLGEDGSAWLPADSAAPDLERAKLTS